MVVGVGVHLEVVAHKVLEHQAELAVVVQAQQVQLVRQELLEQPIRAVVAVVAWAIQVMALADQVVQELS